MKKGIFRRLKSAFIFWLARRLPDCKTMTPVLSQSLDRRLSLREKIVVKLHLFTCGFCGGYFKQIKFLSEAMRKRRESSPENEILTSAKMSSDSKEKLKSALKSASFAL